MRKEIKKKIASMTLLSALLITGIGGQTLNAKNYELKFMNTVVNKKYINDSKGVKGGVYSIKMIKGKYNTATHSYDAVEDGAEYEFTLGDATHPNFSLREATAQGSNSADSGYESVFSLPEGTYEIRQKTPPAGYQADTNVITIDLPFTSEDGQNLLEVLEIKAKLNPILKTINLNRKKDGAPLEGSKFEIIRNDNNPDLPRMLDPKTGEPTNRIEVDGNTTVTVPEGNYTIREIETPPGVQKLPDKIIDINNNTPNIDDNPNIFPEESYDIPSAPVVNTENADVDDGKVITGGDNVIYDTTVNIPKNLGDLEDFKVKIDTDETKVDADKDDIRITIDNVDVTDKFDITEDQNGNFTITPKDKKDPALVGGKDLKITLTGDKTDQFTPGTDTVINSSIEYNNGSGPNTVEGTPTTFRVASNTIHLTLTDGESGANISNATFEIYKNEVSPENLVGTASTADGVIDFANLANGNYKIVQKTTAQSNEGDHYKMIPKPIEITVTNDKATAKVENLELKNFKSNSQLPETGTLGALGFGVAGALAFIVGSKKRKKEEK